MPLNNIWFAMDWKRIAKHHNSCVIKVENDSVRKAFTILDENGLAILRKAYENALSDVIIRG